jgi:phosphopantothenoylcysteine decarboxylase/phosphopantothenate--cysteine ligase
MLTGKNIVLGVTGGVAAWRACPLLIELVLNRHANVEVIMTEHAQKFITELSLRSLSHNPVVCDQFERPTSWDVKHISLARKADLMLIAPCTANVIGKLANGISDDMLTTTVMATRAPVMIAPAMNDQMYDNPIVQENIEKLKKYGYIFFEPQAGVLAYGGSGKGKMADVNDIVDAVVEKLTK